MTLLIDKIKMSYVNAFINLVFSLLSSFLDLPFLPLHSFEVVIVIFASSTANTCADQLLVSSDLKFDHPATHGFELLIA